MRGKAKNNKYYEERTAHNLSGVLKKCLKLREGNPKFWAFRGQRSESWDVGLHHDTASHNNLDTYFEQFQRRCMEFPPHHYMEDSNEWMWLFFAQHYRLKTRLLDWTKDPLVAIYFAVENILSREDDQNTYGAVWALHVNEIHFKNPKDLKNKDINTNNDWILINPPPFTPRIARQSGLFSCHPGNTPQTLNKIPRREKERLVKIKITATKEGNNPTANIRKQLGILNIHHGSLFPDPDGVAQFINEEWADIGNTTYSNKTAIHSGKRQ